ncbi:TetR family transcriptional regulator [Mycobacterium sp. BMJ-28]
MVGRPVDHQHRAELLDAAVDYAAECGFSELSWRTVATGLAVSPTTLVHHFGTKERLIQAVLERLRERTAVATSELAGEQPDLATAARAMWDWASNPRRRAIFTLFFAVYGRALQAPTEYADFVETAGAEVMDTLRRAQGSDVDPDLATRRATLVMATVRGLLLDLLSTKDQSRVREAAEHFLDSL